MAAAVPLGIQYLLDAGIFQSTKEDDEIFPIDAPESADDSNAADGADDEKVGDIPDNDLHFAPGLAPSLGVAGSLGPSAPSRSSLVKSSPVPKTQPSIFWKAVGITLKTVFSGDGDLSESGSALFYASPNQAGILSGPSYPLEVTNYQMYLYCDAMQRVGFPTFKVSGDSYFEFVNLYLKYVAEKEASADVTRARQDLVDAKLAKDHAWEARRKSFPHHVVETGDLAQHSLVDYIKQDKAYKEAWNAEETAEAEFARARGSQLSSASAQLQVVRLADSRLEPQAGYDFHHFLDGNIISLKPLTPTSNNMPVIAVDQDWVQLRKDNPDTDKEKFFDPNLKFYRPLYSIPKYALEVSYWIQGAAISPTDDENGTYSVPLAGVWDRSWSELGHPALDKAAPYVPLTPEMKNFFNSLEVNLRFIKRTFAGDVARGMWDVPDLRDKFELQSSAPQSIREPVCKTSRLFFAWGLEMEVIFPEVLPDAAIKTLSISALGMPLKRVSGKNDRLVFTSSNAGYPVLVGGLADVV